MSALMLWLVLSAPCANASKLSEGAPAPCSGILWSAEQSRKALDCARVDLPTCKARLGEAKALRAAADAQLAAELARPPVEPGDSPSLNWWYGAGGVVVGLFAGVVGLGGLLLGGAWR